MHVCRETFPILSFPHPEELQHLKYLGKHPKYSASSCAEIAERKPDYTNGYYWVDIVIPRLVYCDLQTKFSLGEKGWLRVANFNITDPNQQCPTGFELITEPKPLCIRDTAQPGCSLVYFSTLESTYRLVCGTVGAYRFKTTDGFVRYNCPPPCTINEPYVDGVSIYADVLNRYTHRGSPQHAWTFHSQEQCNTVLGTPPRFIGNSFSCQSYTPVSFCRELLDPASRNHMEVRVCRDQERSDEDIHLEFIELYVQ